MAIQLDIDLTDFRRIEDAVIQTIVRPKYNRRGLLRSRQYPALEALRDPVEEEETEQEKVLFIEQSLGAEMTEYK